MALKALLTVDLENNVSTENRKKFNEKMKALLWTKITALTTTWSSSFKDGVSVTDAISITKTDVATAAKEGNITKYNAAVEVGPEPPTIFSN